MNVSVDGGAEAAAISTAAVHEAHEIADDLELAHERYYACRDLPHETDVWENSDRDCFISLMAKRLDRNDGLSACVGEAAHMVSQCGAATPCSDPLCVSSILLDDTPIEELVAENCGAELDAKAHAELVACR